MRGLYFIAAKTHFLSHFNISKIGMLLIIDMSEFNWPIVFFTVVH